MVQTTGSRMSSDATGDRRSRATRFLRNLPILIMLCVGVAVSIGAFAMVRAFYQEKARNSVAKAARQYTVILGQAISRDLATVESISRFYAASNKVERDEFRTFVRHLPVDHPEIHALEWVPRVPNTSRAAVEKQARREGFPDFRITERSADGALIPAADRDVYFPVFFVEPFMQNAAALGFDLASNPIRRRSLEEARDTGVAVASGRVKLVQEAGDQWSFLVFVPIYRGGKVPVTVERRRAERSGFALGVFRIGDLVLNALRKEGVSAQFRLSVYEQSDLGRRLLFSHGEAPRQEIRRGVLQTDGLFPDTWAEEGLNVAGRHWTLVFQPVGDRIAAEAIYAPLTALLFGLLLTAISVLYAESFRNRTRIVERQVVERTANLLAANNRLEKEIANRIYAEETLRKNEHELIRHRDRLEKTVLERTERIRVQTKRLKEALNTEKEFNAMQREFVLMATHEFRTPLTIIDSTAQSVARRPEKFAPEALRERMEKVRNAVKRLIGLMESALSSVKADVERAKPARAAFDLSEMILEICKEQQDLESSRSISVDVTSLPDAIHAAPETVYQVLNNLVSNAVKYSPSGASIEVRGWTEGDDAVVAVLDRGIGIPETEVSQVFNRFFRASNTSGISGTGIGLYMVKQLAEMDGGSISLTSTEGKGSVFTLRLPIKPGAVDSAAHAETAAAASQAAE